MNGPSQTASPHHPDEPDQFQDPPVHDKFSLRSFRGCPDHCHDRSNEATDDRDAPPTLTAQPAVVLDAERDPSEQVLALVEPIGRVVECIP